MAEEYDVVRCGVWPIKVEEIVDTTGAGDAFISGVIYGLLHGYSAAKMLNLASFVASSKLKGPGARAGLPKREAVPPQLL
jgi:sugar/nucleoside kinase (ribokinase family)